MKASSIATLSALMLTLCAGAAATAGETDAQLAWQQPGYVLEVVIATAPRPQAVATPEPSAAGALAWQQPGYVEETVVVRASRREILAAAMTSRLQAVLENRPFMGITRN